MSGNNQPGLPSTSLNYLLEDAIRLQNNRHYRNDKQLFFIEGVKNFNEAIDNKFTIERILYSEQLLKSVIARKHVRQLRRRGITTVKLSPEQFRRISNAKKVSGVAAVCKQRWSKLETSSPNLGLCWNVMGSVNSPGNFGTLIRSSESIGCAGFILLDRDVDPYMPSTVRSTMGAVFRQRFIRTNLAKLRKWIQKNQCEIIGASPDGIKELHHFNFRNTRLLMLGEERKGLTEAERNMCDHLVRIPMVGHSDSLNLAVAGSLFMYEVFRNKKY